MATHSQVLMRNYYAEAYPVEALAWLATRRGDALGSREWALDGAYYKRYVTAEDGDGLRKVLVGTPEVQALHIGPIYSGEVQKSRSGVDTRLLFEQSRPHRKELVVDIDLSDYDYLDLSNGPADPKGLCLEACDAAWPIAGIAITLLQRVLRAQFGFCEFLCFYSGRRGVHLWVLDERAMALEGAGREAIASFLDLQLTPCKQRATSAHRAFAKSYHLMETVHEFFETVLVSQMGLLDPLAARDGLLDRLGLGVHDSMHNLADEASRKDSGFDAWIYIKTKVLRQSQRLAKECGWFEARLDEVVLAYVWPRLDFNVTKGLNHLIKAPFVAHPKTLRVAVPLRRDELMTFDPSTAPTLGTASVYEALAARGGSADGGGLADWVWRTPVPPCKSTKTTKPSRSSKSSKSSKSRKPTQHQSPPASEATAMDVDVDVEDLVPAPRETHR